MTRFQFMMMKVRQGSVWQATENDGGDCGNDGDDESGDDNEVNQAGKHVASQRATILQMERTLFHIDQV